MHFKHVHVLFFLENRLNSPSAKWDYLKNKSNFCCKRKEGTVHVQDQYTYMYIHEYNMQLASFDRY